MNEPTPPAFTAEERTILECYSRYPNQYKNDPAVKRREAYWKEHAEYTAWKREQERIAAKRADDERMEQVKQMLKAFAAKLINSTEADKALKALSHK